MAYSSIIDRSKYGNCTRCPEKDTECRKRGKDLVCLQCCKIEDTQKQVAKANLRNRVRNLGNKQRMEGNEDAASRQNLINDLDYVFSRIVRLRAADPYGNVKCYTCTTVKHFSLMQNGHYVSRRHIGLRWSFDNCRPQCTGCNELKSGNLEAFKENLEVEVAGLPQNLENEAKNVVKIDLPELKQMLFDFRNKLKPLEQRFLNPKTT